MITDIESGLSNEREGMNEQWLIDTVDFEHSHDLIKPC